MLRKKHETPKVNYDRRATNPCIRENEFVWVFNPAKKKGVSPKLQLKWEGPFLVLKKLSDVVVRIQKLKGAKPRVIHVDRLKPYQGSPIDPWSTPSRAPSCDTEIGACAENVQGHLKELESSDKDGVENNHLVPLDGKDGGNIRLEPLYDARGGDSLLETSNNEDETSCREPLKDMGTEINTCAEGVEEHPEELHDGGVESIQKPWGSKDAASSVQKSKETRRYPKRAHRLPLRFR
ncbi:uncharacterized protein LOC119724030 [Patiria miniata]|uniref:Integrase p58-like C-terminal domain-containing protein n=1 Tax=Patiria miniata TaxID=46514 RepID=A0A913ZGG9_PATMI|nr:uncharacterized protein LOC119724030 [Patiria miniata]